MNESPDNLKVVFDTNIYIAAFLKSGLADFLVRQANEGKFEIFSSEQILTELREKLITKFGVETERADRFCDRLKKQSSIIEKPRTEETAGAVEDAEDEKILACALAAQAHLVISLDKHLLKLKNFRGVAIVHPKTLTWMIPDY